MIKRERIKRVIKGIKEFIKDGIDAFKNIKHDPWASVTAKYFIALIISVIAVIISIANIVAVLIQ